MYKMFVFRYWEIDSLDKGINFWHDLIYYQSCKTYKI